MDSKGSAPTSSGYDMDTGNGGLALLESQRAAQR